MNRTCGWDIDIKTREEFEAEGFGTSPRRTADDEPDSGSVEAASATADDASSDSPTEKEADRETPSDAEEPAADTAPEGLASASGEETTKAAQAGAES